MKKCNAPNCDRQGRHTAGLCNMHYLRFRRYGNLDEPDHRLKPKPSLDSKQCGACERELPIAAFAKNGSRYNSSWRKSICRECCSKEGKKLRAARKAVGICPECDRAAVSGKIKCEFHLKLRLSYLTTPYARANALWHSASRRARQFGLKCTITTDWIFERLSAGCELTGLPFDLETGDGRKKGHFNPYAPSIDKRIPGGDYSPENSRVVLAAINMGLNSWGEEVYRTVAKAYLKHRRANKNKTNSGSSKGNLDLLTTLRVQ